MRCPFCASEETQVKDSRPAEDNQAIRRRRLCSGCGARFTTLERVQLRELTVIKTNGEEQPFEREKLARSILVATRKRPVSGEQVDRMVTGIVRQLESLGVDDVSTHDIGAAAMEALKAIDKVSYIRFASVYRNFTEASDFEDFVTHLDELRGRN